MRAFPLVDSVDMHTNKLRGQICGLPKCSCGQVNSKNKHPSVSFHRTEMPSKYHLSIACTSYKGVLQVLQSSCAEKSPLTTSRLHIYKLIHDTHCRGTVEQDVSLVHGRLRLRSQKSLNMLAPGICLGQMHYCNPFTRNSGPSVSCLPVQSVCKLNKAQLQPHPSSYRESLGGTVPGSLQPLSQLTC